MIYYDLLGFAGPLLGRSRARARGVLPGAGPGATRRIRSSYGNPVRAILLPHGRWEGFNTLDRLPRTVGVFCPPGGPILRFLRILANEARELA